MMHREAVIFCFLFVFFATRANCQQETSKSLAESRLFVNAQGGDHQNAYNFVTNPRNSAFFITRFWAAWVAVHAALVILHFLVWDYNDTQPGEHVNFRKQFNFFANPDTALENLYITWGHTLVISAFWIIPTLFWPGEPIDESQPEFGGKSNEAEEKLYAPPVEDELGHVMRRILCPDCVLNITLTNTLVVLGMITWWNISPYFRQFDVSAVFRKKRKRRNVNEMAAEPLNEETENLVLRSIQEMPTL